MIRKYAVIFFLFDNLFYVVGELLTNHPQHQPTTTVRIPDHTASEANRIRRELSEERLKLAVMKWRMVIMERERRNDALKQERRREKTLARLARQADRDRMPGNNIGVFGLTSTGKSTVINGLVGRQVAAVGVGETTRHKKAYQGMHCTYWDTPGRNDESTYTNEEYISFIKGLTRRLIVVQYTVKENLKLMQLLDSLGLGYDIIVNKFDDVDEDEQWTFRRQIERETISFGLQRVKHTYFLSAKHSKMFPDWLTMVTHLTESCSDCKSTYYIIISFNSLLFIYLDDQNADTDSSDSYDDDEY